MEETAKKILETYKIFKIKKNSPLLFKALHMKMLNWENYDQDKFLRALEILLKEGYLKKTKETLSLTEKGYGQVYNRLKTLEEDNII